MVNKKIVVYLKDGLSKGRSMNLLKKQLVDSGWCFEDVVGAIDYINDALEKEKVEKMKGKKNKKSKKKSILADYLRVPIGVKIVSFLFWIVAGAWALKTVNSLMVKDFIFLDLLSISISGLSDRILEGGFIFFSVFFIFLIGFGLWNGKKVRRAIAIFFAMCFVSYNVLLLVGVVESLILVRDNYFMIINSLGSLFVFLYLLISKKGKEHFGL